MSMITINHVGMQNPKFEVYNSLGAMCFDKGFISRCKCIDVSFFASGIYTIRVIGNDSVYQQKLVKE
jgi:hypothetical protein